MSPIPNLTPPRRESRASPPGSQGGAPNRTNELDGLAAGANMISERGGSLRRVLDVNPPPTPRESRLPSLLRTRLSYGIWLNDAGVLNPRRAQHRRSEWMHGRAPVGPGRAPRGLPMCGADRRRAEFTAVATRTWATIRRGPVGGNRRQRFSHAPEPRAWSHRPDHRRPTSRKAGKQLCERQLIVVPGAIWGLIVFALWAVAFSYTDTDRIVIVRTPDSKYGSGLPSVWSLSG